MNAVTSSPTPFTSGNSPFGETLSGRFIHASELENYPPLSYLVPGEIPETSFVVMYGQSGSGKSFLALDYAAQILKQGGAVLYLAAEGQSGYPDRVRALAHHYQFDLKTKPIYFGFNGFNLASLDEVDIIVSCSPVRCPALIVVDTLARCMFGDENSARDMGMFIHGCDVLREKLGATVLVVHHTGKSGASERGSSALRAAADVMMEVRRENDLITVECDKFKDAAPFPVKRFRKTVVEFAPNETSCVLIPTDDAEPAEDASILRRDQLKILALLNDPAYLNIGVHSEFLRYAVQLGNSSFHRALKTLRETGCVSQIKRSAPYLITEVGKAFLKHPDQPPTVIFSEDDLPLEQPPLL